MRTRAGCQSCDPPFRSPTDVPDQDLSGGDCDLGPSGGTSIFPRGKQRRTAEPERTIEAMELHTIVAIQAADPLMAAVLALRREVFVVEQHIPHELEVDEDDKIATHV